MLRGEEHEVAFARLLPSSAFKGFSLRQMELMCFAPARFVRKERLGDRAVLFP